MSKLSFVIYKFWRDVYIIKDVERLIIDPYLTHGSNIYILLNFLGRIMLFRKRNNLLNSG